MLIAQPLPSEHHFIASLHFSNEDGNTLDLDHLDFQLKQRGTEEATLENVETGALIKIQLIASFTTQKMTIKFRWHLDKSLYSSNQLLQFYELQKCLSKPFTIRIVSKEFGVELLNQHYEKGILDPPSQFYLDTLQALSFLQKKSNRIVMVPMIKLSNEEISDLNKLTNIVKSGKTKGTWIDFKIILRDLSPDGINALSDHLHVFRFDSNEVVNIFGTELPLGISEAVFQNGIISNLREVQEAYNAGTKDIEIHVVAHNGEAKFEKTYRDFIKEGVDKQANNIPT